MPGTFNYPVKYRSNQLIYGTMFKDNDPFSQKKEEVLNRKPGSYTIVPG